MAEPSSSAAATGEQAAAPKAPPRQPNPAFRMMGIFNHAYNVPDITLLMLIDTRKECLIFALNSPPGIG